MYKKMGNRIIKSEKQVDRSPAVAFILSFLVSGLGQAYNGELLKGIVFFLLRFFPLLLFPLAIAMQPNELHIHGFVVMCLFQIFIWICSAVEALLAARKNRVITGGRYVSWPFCGISGILASLLYAGSLFHLVLYFDIVPVETTLMSPSMLPGEQALIYSYGMEQLDVGDIVLYRGKGKTGFGRIISQEKGVVWYSAGRFLVNRRELSIGVYSEQELSSRGYDNLEHLYLEINGKRKYPIQYKNVADAVSRNTIAITGGNRLLVSSDNRMEKEVYRVIEKGAVIGKVEGIVYTENIRRLFLLPYEKLKD